MNQYTLLKAANRTTDNDKIFHRCELGVDLGYITDLADWKITSEHSVKEFTIIDLPFNEDTEYLPSTVIKTDKIV